jgi:hypothetical protein
MKKKNWGRNWLLLTKSHSSFSWLFPKKESFTSFFIFPELVGNVLEEVICMMTVISEKGRLISAGYHQVSVIGVVVQFATM